jgi:hypothetical protein
MSPSRRRSAVATSLTLAALVALAQPAVALHGGAAVDCGDAGTFTIRATPNGAGFEAPVFTGVILFEEGGSLTLEVVYRNGVLQWDDAAVGVAANAIEETTCTFTAANGDYTEVTGVLTGYGSAAD